MNASVLNLPTNAKASSFSNPANNMTLNQLSGNAMGTNNSLQYNQNKQLMNIANNFNNYMSNTAYQRTVNDMEKAGVNPTIAFGLGKGMLDSSLSSATSSVSSIAGKFGSSLLGALGSMLKMLFFI